MKLAETATTSKVVKKGATKPAASKSPSTTIIATSDVNGGAKNVEVFSQGQKILGSTNSLNVSDLPEGTYLLKISSTPSKKITSN